MEADPDGPAVARRIAPWSIVFLVASALLLTFAALLKWWPLAILAGLVGLFGLGLLVFASLREGRRRGRRPYGFV